MSFTVWGRVVAVDLRKGPLLGLLRLSFAGRQVGRGEACVVEAGSEKQPVQVVSSDQGEQGELFPDASLPDELEIGRAHV